MLKRLVLAGVAVGLTALNAPVAHASVVRSGCGFETVAQETVTGGQDTFTGAVYGYAVFDDQGTHTLRCYVTVDGVDQGGVSGGGTVFVAVAGNVTYNAPEGASVDLCTEIDGATVACSYATQLPFPPQEVIDALDTVFATIDSVLLPVEQDLDTVVCPILASASPGIPGVVDINAEGDTTLAVVGPFWDCPPYGNLFPPA